MRFNYLITSLVLIPFYSFSHADQANKNMFFLQNPVNKYTVVKSNSNESDGLSVIKTSTRSTDYPTQIIRMASDLDGQLTCDDVNKAIENEIVSYITKDRFAYNTYYGCTYDPDTLYATHFFINSYFDPVSDEAISYLNSFLTEHNGADFLNTKIQIESAKALVISLNITAGIKKNPKQPPFIEYRQDRSNYYFTSNYEMRNKLFPDISQNFLTNEPEKIFAFLDKWIFSSASVVYKPVLRDSNYVELQPERIFLMDNGEKIFVSNLKYYFVHDCNKYDNHRCLPTGV